MSDLQSGFLFILGILLAVAAYVHYRFRKYAIKIVLSILIISIFLNISIFLCLFLFRTNHTALSSWVGLSPHKITIFLMDGIILGYVSTNSIWPKYRYVLSEKKRSILFNLLKLVMASYFLFAGIGKIFNHTGMLEFFQSSGYNSAMLDFIITLEISCAIGIIFKATTLPATVLLIGDMLGATFTHYHNFFTAGIPEPFSNSIDSLKMLPFLLTILLMRLNNAKQAKSA